DVDVTHQRTDLHAAVVAANLVEPGNPLNVNQRGRLAQAEPHQRDEALSTGYDLRVGAVFRQQRLGFIDRARSRVLECRGDHARASLIIDQRRSGRAGISTCLMPNGASASVIALITAMLDAIVPASPMPLTPSSLVGLGVTVRSSSKRGISAIVGMR